MAVDLSPQAVDVTVLMPCLNEANALPVAIDRAQEALARFESMGLSGEILMADNGSTDASQQIAADQGCRVIHCEQPGYGAALRRGCENAQGTYILMGDADASYDFCEGVAMVEKLQEGYDFCMGNRFQGTIHPGAMPWKNRYIGNPLLTGVLNLFYRAGIGDAHCGLRAIRKDKVLGLNLSSTGMEFASEMVVKAAINDLRIAEVPISLHPDQRGRKPHLKPWRDGLRHLWFLLMFQTNSKDGE